MKTFIRIALGMMLALMTACTTAPASTADVMPINGAMTFASSTVRPTSAAGYKAMFDKVSTSYWGFSDGAESQPLPDKRVVWLFGDTPNAVGGFVHSSAIVQKGSVAKVANGGAQILPNGPTQPDGRKSVYWIEDSRYVGTAKDGGAIIHVTAAYMALGEGFNFDRIGCQSRQAVVKVDKYYNKLTFLYWRAWVPVPNQYDDWHVIDTGHTGGIVKAHGWASLTSGKVLTTTSHWYDGTYTGTEPTLRERRPIFSEGSGIEKLATYEDWLRGKAGLGDAGSAAKLAECFPS